MKKIERWVEVGLLGTLSIISSVAFGTIYEKFGWQSIIIGALCSFLVVVLYSISVSFGIKSKNEERLKRAINALNNAIHSAEGFKDKPNWLFSLDDLDEMEGTLGAKDIWVVSPNLENDTLNAGVIPTLKENARKGVCYTYVVPDTELIHARLHQLWEIFKETRCEPRIIIMPLKQFSLMTITHITIYNPKGTKGVPGRVFLELPLKARKWWVEMCREDGEFYTAIIDEIIRTHAVETLSR